MIENLPDSDKDKKEYLLSLKDSIDIPIVCIRCRKYGHHVTDCRKEENAKKEKDKKEKIKIKQDKKLITLQQLVTEVKMIKQEIKEIKEDNSTDINEHNITEIINLKEHSRPMVDLPSLVEEDINILLLHYPCNGKAENITGHCNTRNDFLTCNFKKRKAIYKPKIIACIPGKFS